MLVLVSLTIVACTTKEDEVIVDNNSSDNLPLTAGSANFSKYVAVGNSLTAGFSDNALFIEGQKGAWTNIIAQQFKLVGGGDFKIPFMADNIGGLLLGTIPLQGPRLFFNGVAPGPVSGTPSTQATTVLTGQFNNMGVPGAKSFHLLSNSYGKASNILLGTANPYFVRFASAENATILGDAVAQAPTFFSLWIGNNDVLSYATNCGDGVNRLGNPDPTTYGSNDLTDPTLFAGVYSNIVNGMTAGGAKGVVANIPNVTTLPYFYVVKYNQLTQANLVDPISGLSVIPQLNQGLYNPLSGALQFLGQGNRISPLSTTGNNPMLMIDENLTDLSVQLSQVITGGLIQQGVDPAVAAAQGGALGAIFGKARQTRPTDLIGLNAASRIGRPTNMMADGVVSPVPTLNNLGVSFPLPDKYVLLPEEIPAITAATNAFNATIKSIAEAKGLAFVDANKILTDVATIGVTSNGYTVNSTFVTGGAFSLDGVHPSPRGYALIANEFIKAINAKYGSNLKGVSFADYRILYPSSL